MPVQLPSTRLFSGTILETRGHLISSFKSVFLSGPSRSSPENPRREVTCKAFGTRQPLVRAARARVSDPQFRVLVGMAT